MLGAMLLVAAMTGQHTYTVKSGDTLSSVAASYGETWGQVYQANTDVISNPNLIYAGETIVIPVAGESYQASEQGEPSAEVHSETPPAQPSPAANSQTYSGAPGSFQGCVIQRESGGDSHAVNASSGAGGLYQFLPSTWASLGYSGSPQNAPVSEQNAAFQRLYAQDGTSPWAPSDGC